MATPTLNPSSSDSRGFTPSAFSPRIAGNITHNVGDRIETCDRRDGNGKLLKGGDRGIVIECTDEQVSIQWDTGLRHKITRRTYDSAIRHAIWGPI